MNLAEAVEGYLRKCGADGINDHTIRQKRRLLRPFVLYVNKNPDQISLDDIYRFINSLSVSPEVMFRTKVHLKGLFKFLNERDVSKIPFTLIQNHQPESKPTQNITEDEWKQIEEYLHSHLQTKQYRRLHACVHILWETGLRRSELVRIKLSDLEKDSFVVQTSKTGKVRRCYFYFDLSGYLKEFHPKERVFEICLNRLAVLNHEMFEKLGINKSLHSYRAGFITRLCRNGANIQDVSRIVAHSNINTTMRYLTTDDQYLRGICEQYNNSPRVYEFKTGLGKRQGLKIELKISKTKHQN